MRRAASRTSRNCVHLRARSAARPPRSSGASWRTSCVSTDDFTPWMRRYMLCCSNSMFCRPTCVRSSKRLNEGTPIVRGAEPESPRRAEESVADVARAHDSAVGASRDARRRRQSCALASGKRTSRVGRDFPSVLPIEKRSFPGKRHSRNWPLETSSRDASTRRFSNQAKLASRSAPCVLFCRETWEPRQKRANGWRGAATRPPPLHATRDPTPRRRERDVAGIARGVARSARVAPRADARRLRGARPTPPATPSRAARKAREPARWSARRDDARGEPRASARWRLGASATFRATRRCVTTRRPGRPRDPVRASFDVRDGDFSPFVQNRSVHVVRPRRPLLGPPLDDPLADETGCAETRCPNAAPSSARSRSSPAARSARVSSPSPPDGRPRRASARASGRPRAGWLGGVRGEALLLAEVNVALMRERDEYRLEHGRGHSPVDHQPERDGGPHPRRRRRRRRRRDVSGTSCPPPRCSGAYVAKSGAIVAGVLAGTHWVGVDVDARARRVRDRPWGGAQPCGGVGSPIR